MNVWCDVHVLPRISFDFYKFQCVLIYDAFILKYVGQSGVNAECSLKKCLLQPSQDLCRTKGRGKTATRDTLSQWMASM